MLYIYICMYSIIFPHIYSPECPRTQYFRTLVQTAIHGIVIVFGTRVLNGQYVDPLGFDISNREAPTAPLRAPLDGRAACAFGSESLHADTQSFKGLL